MRCILVRHPPLDAPQGLCYGRLELAWSAAGAQRASAIVRALLGCMPARVFTSPAARCWQLAIRLTPAPITDNRLLELDFGTWEGRSWDDIPRAELDPWAADPARIAPPGGETGAALLARVRSFAEDLRDRGEDALVILHGGPMKLLRALLANEPPDLLAPAPPPGTILELQLSAASTTVSATTAAAPSTSPV